MNIIQDLIPKGRKNRPGRKNPIEFITIHNTGNTDKGAGAKNHAAYLKSDAAANAPVSWHYTVDEKDVYQHLPDTEDGFHAGDGGGNGNRKSIGIEICMNSDGNLTAATENAVLLVAFLLDKYNLPIDRVVQHNHWSGKDCPQMLRAGNPYSWVAFLAKVRSNYVATTHWAQGAVEWLQGAGVLDSPLNSAWKDLDKPIANITVGTLLSLVAKSLGWRNK